MGLPNITDSGVPLNHNTIIVALLTCQYEEFVGIHWYIAKTNQLTQLKNAEYLHYHQNYIMASTLVLKICITQYTSGLPLS